MAAKILLSWTMAYCLFPLLRSEDLSMEIQHYSNAQEIPSILNPSLDSEPVENPFENNFQKEKRTYRLVPFVGPLKRTMPFDVIRSFFHSFLEKRAAFTTQLPAYQVHARNRYGLYESPFSEKKNYLKPPDDEQWYQTTNKYQNFDFKDQVYTPIMSNSTREDDNTSEYLYENATNETSNFSSFQKSSSTASKEILTVNTTESTTGNVKNENQAEVYELSGSDILETFPFDSHETSVNAVFDKNEFNKNSVNIRGSPDSQASVFIHSSVIENPRQQNNATNIHDDFYNYYDDYDESAETFSNTPKLSWHLQPPPPSSIPENLSIFTKSEDSPFKGTSSPNSYFLPNFDYTDQFNGFNINNDNGTVIITAEKNVSKSDFINKVSDILNLPITVPTYNPFEHFVTEKPTTNSINKNEVFFNPFLDNAFIHENSDKVPLSLPETDKVYSFQTTSADDFDSLINSSSSFFPLKIPSDIENVHSVSNKNKNDVINQNAHIIIENRTHTPEFFVVDNDNEFSDFPQPLSIQSFTEINLNKNGLHQQGNLNIISFLEALQTTANVSVNVSPDLSTSDIATAVVKAIEDRILQNSKTNKISNKNNSNDSIFKFEYAIDTKITHLPNNISKNEVGKGVIVPPIKEDIITLSTNSLVTDNKPDIFNDPQEENNIDNNLGNSFILDTDDLSKNIDEVSSNIEADFANFEKIGNINAQDKTFNTSNNKINNKIQLASLAIQNIDVSNEAEKLKLSEDKLGHQILTNKITLPEKNEKQIQFDSKLEGFEKVSTSDQLVGQAHLVANGSSITDLTKQPFPFTTTTLKIHSPTEKTVIKNNDGKLHNENITPLPIIRLSSEISSSSKGNEKLITANKLTLEDNEATVKTQTVNDFLKNTTANEDSKGNNTVPMENELLDVLPQLPVLISSLKTLIDKIRNLSYHLNATNRFYLENSKDVAAIKNVSAINKLNSTTPRDILVFLSNHSSDIFPNKNEFSVIIPEEEKYFPREDKNVSFTQSASQSSFVNRIPFLSLVLTGKTENENASSRNKKDVQLTPFLSLALSQAGYLMGADKKVPLKTEEDDMLPVALPLISLPPGHNETIHDSLSTAHKILHRDSKVSVSKISKNVPPITVSKPFILSLAMDLPHDDFQILDIKMSGDHSSKTINKEKLNYSSEEMNTAESTFYVTLFDTPNVNIDENTILRLNTGANKVSSLSFNNLSQKTDNLTPSSTTSDKLAKHYDERSGSVNNKLEHLDESPLTKVQTVLLEENSKENLIDDILKKANIDNNAVEKIKSVLDLMAAKTSPPSPKSSNDATIAPQIPILFQNTLSTPSNELNTNSNVVLLIDNDSNITKKALRPPPEEATTENIFADRSHLYLWQQRPLPSTHFLEITGATSTSTPNSVRLPWVWNNSNKPNKRDSSNSSRPFIPSLGPPPKLPINNETKTNRLPKAISHYNFKSANDAATSRWIWRGRNNDSTRSYRHLNSELLSKLLPSPRIPNPSFHALQLLRASENN